MMYTLLSQDDVKRDIFGSEHVVCPLNYPTSVNKLIEGGLFSKEECHKLLKENALLPYLLFAVNPTKRDEVYSSIWGFSPYSWTIVNLLGLNTTGFKSSNLPKYCPVCNSENLEKYGELYWNRNHQIPGIGICVEHKCFLEEIVPDESTYRKYPLYLPTTRNCPVKEARISRSLSIELVARNCIEILRGNKQVDFNYSDRIKRLNYTIQNNVDHRSIERDFNKFYSDEHFLGMHYDIRFISQPGARTNPYLNVMIDAFISHFSSREKERFWDKHFFGEGPWTCVNSKCKGYFKPRIANVKFNFDYKYRRTIGYFKCDCGVRFNKCFTVNEGTITSTHIMILHRERLNVSQTGTSNAQIHNLINKRAEWLRLKYLPKKTVAEYYRNKALSKWLKGFDSLWFTLQANKYLEKSLKDSRKRDKQGLQLKAIVPVIRSLTVNPPSDKVSKMYILRRASIHPEAKILPMAQTAIDNALKTNRKLQLSSNGISE